MSALMTMDIEPYNLDYEDQKVAWCQEIFKIMKPSEQAEFLADIQPKPDIPIHELITQYRNLSISDKRRFKRGTNLIHKDPIKNTLDELQTTLANLIEQIGKIKGDI